MFDIFNSNCEKSFNFSDNVTVDEMLVLFRGKCNVRQYIPSKPNKYGIKIFAICDSRMFYTGGMEVYLGTQPDGPYKISNKSSDVVLRLSQNIYGSDRNITIDNWFTAVGTIRKNKRELAYLLVGQKRQACLHLERNLLWFPTC